MCQAAKKHNTSGIHVTIRRTKQPQTLVQLQSPMCKFQRPYSPISSLLPLQSVCRFLSAQRCLVLFYVPLSSEQTSEASGSHVDRLHLTLASGAGPPLPQSVCQRVSPLLSLPDPSITFHWAQFRFWVWRHGTP